MEPSSKMTEIFDGDDLPFFDEALLIAFRETLKTGDPKRWLDNCFDYAEALTIKRREYLDKLYE